MCRVLKISVFLLVGLMCLMRTEADTFQLTDGTTVSGELVSPNELGVLLRLPDGSYSDRVPWVRFSQADLKRIAENPRIKPLVEPFIEVPEDELPQKPEITVNPVKRLQRPERAPFLNAFVSSSVGFVIILLLYAANLFAAYEVSIIRAYSPALVCGTAAVLPVIGPIIFLCMPTKMKTDEHARAEVAAAQRTRAQAAAEVAVASAALGLGREDTGVQVEAELPPTQVFKRGQYVFNRRFFETKFSGFFGVLRREADKDMVLSVKTPHGVFTVERFTRITANEMYFLTRRATGAAEMTIAFTEVQEVELRHKDAPQVITDR